jgi:microcystin-dependent protein
MATYQYPLGSILVYSGPLSATSPTFVALNAQGWEMCDGGQASRTTYADYFALVGTTWGAGDGSTTFNLPDLRGQFLRGVDPTGMLDPDGVTRHNKYTDGNTGNEVGSYQYTATKLPNTSFVISISGDHDHEVSHLPSASVYSNLSAVGNKVPLWSSDQETSTDGDHSHSLSGGDNESRGPNANVNYLVMARLVSDYSSNATVTIAGPNVIDTVAIASGTSCFWNWTAYSNDGANYKAGTFLASWQPSTGTISVTSGTSTTAIGIFDLTFDATVSSSNVYFTATSISDNWTVKAKRTVL